MLAQEKLAWWAAGSYTTAENKDLAGFFSRMAEIRRTFEQAAKVDKKAAELLQTLARIEQAFRARQEDAAGDSTFDGRNAAPVDIGTMQLWYRQFEDYLLKQWDKSNPLRAKLIKLIKEAEANLGKVYVSRQSSRHQEHQRQAGKWEFSDLPTPCPQGARAHRTSDFTLALLGDGPELSRGIHSSVVSRSGWMIQRSVHKNG